MTVAPWWEKTKGEQLYQGDYLPQCMVPLMPEDFSPSDSDVSEFEAQEFDLIVVTQSCDLENDKAPWVALCPVFGIGDFERENPKFKGQWEQARQGRREGLHLLASLTDPADNQTALVVDFRQVFSLPIGYLKRRALLLGERIRLKSPYVEHFSQAFARFFMRVGLPSNIPPFK